MTRDAAGELGTCESDAAADQMQWAPDQHRYIRLTYILLGGFIVGLVFAAGFLAGAIWQAGR